MRRGLFKRKKAIRVEASLMSFKLGYINLMITLVPFLLSIALFSKLAILELHLPDLPDGADPGVVALQTSDAPRRFALTVAIEEEGLRVSNGPEPIALIPRQDGRLDDRGLSILMERLKKDHTEEKEVVILSGPKTLYEELISVMDACRQMKVAEKGGVRVQLLFPNVSLGEAL